MPSYIIHYLFIITILLSAFADTTFAQTPTAVELPCTSVTPSRTFCMGSLGDEDAAYTGSGKPIECCVCR